MPALRKGRPSVEDRVRAELELIRAHVAGVRGSLAATSDGLVVAHDLPDVEPTQVAALAAATLALASRATLATGCGNFREAVARGSDGYLAFYAAGDSAIVAVVGTRSLNVGMLQYRAREFIEHIATFATQIGLRAAAGRAAAPAPAGAATPTAATAAPVGATAKTAAPRGQARPDSRPANRPPLPRRRPASN
jgi:predicted regulator of Ras-like GTPase activity (Roadblock/LC7/MglB family)